MLSQPKLEFILMDDIVKIRRNSCGKFRISHRDKYFRTKQRGSRDYFAQRYGHRVCVLGDEEVSFLNQKTITGKIFGGILHMTQL